ncbi:TIGR02757 family protein [Spirochaetia bacterium]|nr:TIGR02757 family protein [Spirochaetia bacterium]
MKRLSATDADIKRDNLAQELDRWYKKIDRPEFIPNDPVQFPRRYAKRADIEIAAFLAATIAWGRRDLILRSAERMFALMGPSPADFVMSGNYRKLKDKCVHRTFFEDDLKYFCRGFKACYAKYGSLEKLFATAIYGAAITVGARGIDCGALNRAGSIWEGIALFRETMAAANGGRYTKHIANPGESSGAGRNESPGSACKRINLALRWLVREGPVDLGLWKHISPAALYIPLDVHVAHTARRLGLLERKSNDKKAVIALTEKLREFCPQDPVKYDFALFSM